MGPFELCANDAAAGTISVAATKKVVIKDFTMFLL